MYIVLLHVFMLKADLCLTKIDCFFFKSYKSNLQNANKENKRPMGHIAYLSNNSKT